MPTHVCNADIMVTYMDAHAKITTQRPMKCGFLFVQPVGGLLFHHDLSKGLLAFFRAPYVKQRIYYTYT